MDPVRVKGRRGSRVPWEFHGFEGLRCRRFKVSQVLGRQVSKVEGAPGFLIF